MSSDENQPAVAPSVTGTPVDEIHAPLTQDTPDSTVDPTHRVGHLKLAKKKPVCVRPTATIPEAITLMMMHDFSQLPVMIGERTVKGIFSWKSLGQKLALKQKCNYVKEAMEEAVIINVNRSLFDAARLVAESDCILIRDDQEVISGILTSYDLSVNFAERSEPFLLLEQIEKHVRRYVENKTLRVGDAGRPPISDPRTPHHRCIEVEFRGLCEDFAKTGAMEKSGTLP